MTPAILLIVAQLAGADGGQPFPGRHGRRVSPDGRHELVWVLPDEPNACPRLLLRVTRTDTRLILMDVCRHVEAFWSPSGRHLAVTDSWASDESTVRLWTALERPSLDLLAELAKHEHESVRRWDAHHLYLSAIEWKDDRTLVLRLWGYGEPPGSVLDRRYAYVIGRGFQPR